MIARLIFKGCGDLGPEKKSSAKVYPILILILSKLEVDKGFFLIIVKSAP